MWHNLDMNTISLVKKILSDEKETLSKKYNVSRIGVFGSVVCGEDTKDSDIDILVDFSKPIGLFDFMNMENYLAKKLGKKVDLVSYKALKPNIGKRILSEVIYV